VSKIGCPRAGKWIGGCRFEARFDRYQPRVLTEKEIYWLDVNDRVPALAAASSTTYVRDVCVTCGRTIERQGANA
jgi:hypothetical protein